MQVRSDTLYGRAEEFCKPTGFPSTFLKDDLRDGVFTGVGERKMRVRGAELFEEIAGVAGE